MDALAELEKLRRQALHPRPNEAAAQSGGHEEIRRELKYNVAQADLRRAKRLSLTLQLEDQDQQLIDEVHQVHLDIENADSLEHLLLRLKIALNARNQ